MRTIDSSISPAEILGAVHPTETLITSNEILSFAAYTSQANSSLETGVPQSFAARNGGTYGYAAYRYTDGTSKLQVIAYATVANWAMNGGGQVNANTVLCMRNGVFTDSGNTTWLYTAAASGSAIQVKRQNITAITTNPPTISLSNFGPTFGEVLNDSATVVRRVEAVCPTDNGVIVAVGTHRFDSGYSTIQFYWIADSTHAYTLQTILQMPLTETYTNWYSAAKYCTYISAIYNSTTAAMWIVANAHPSGKAVIFSLQSGVESMLKPVVPIDPQYGSVTFVASALTIINSLVYMTGRYTYTKSNGGTLAYDCYLISSDGNLWSFGERNHYIQQANSSGALLVDTASSPVYVYYGGDTSRASGNVTVTRAIATPLQGYNTGTMQLDLSSRLMDGWTFSQVTNAANTFRASFRNAQGTLTDYSLLTGGSVLYLSCGQAGTNSAMGVFSVDSPGTGVDKHGNKEARISARDVGTKALTRHNVPADIDYWSMDVLSTTLSTDQGLVVKTRTSDILNLDASATSTPVLADYDILMDSLNGLRSKALNNPLVAYADVAQAPDLLMKATVTFPDTGSAYALPSFAFLFNASDSGDFSGVIIPKTNSWGSKTKPRVVTSNLAPFDTTTQEGGFNFEKRYQGLWYSNNTGSDAYLQAVSEAASHYTTETAFTQAAGAVRDHACLMHGGRVLLYHKLRDYAAATAAGNAGYTLVLDYQYSNDVYMALPERLRPGFAVNTDAWALTGTAGGLADPIEAQLTDAGDNDGSGNYNVTIVADAWVGPSPSAHRIDNWVPATYGVHADMYIYVVRTSGSTGTATGVFRVASVDGSGATMETTFDSGTTNNHWHLYGIENSVTWGYADSGYKTVDAGGGASVQLQPSATKRSTLVAGKAAFADDGGTVCSIRWVTSDGLRSYLYSGNSGGTEQGWDVTTPETDPQAWRIIMRPNKLFDNLPASYGLPTSGYMVSAQEIFQYAGYSLAQQGYGNTATTDWTAVPTFYAPLTTQGGGTNTVTQWTDLTNMPGDDLGAVTNAAGMLFEITSKSGAPSLAVPLRIQSVTQRTPAAGGSFVTLTSTLPIEIRGAGAYSDAGDFGVMRGRAMLGSTLSPHANTDPLCFYPVPITATSAISSFVTVSRFDVFSGRRASVENCINYFCALAGVRSPSFRNYMTGASATAAYNLALTTTPQSLPLVSTVSDFVLDATVHIDATAWLQIDFRTSDGSNAYYRLALKQTATGKITVGLQAIGSSITAGGLSTFKWLEYAEVPFSPVDICPTAADTVALRIAVQNNLVYVEVNRAPLWTFNLDHYIHTDGTSYKKTTSFAIKLSYSTPGVAGNSGYFRVPELWQDVPNLTVQMGANTASTLRALCGKHYVRSRATAGGSLEFSQFIVRDSGITLTKGLQTHDRSSDDTHPVAALIVAGQQTGGYMNTTYAASDGFSFGVAQNSDALTTMQSDRDAQLRVRELIEFTATDTINGVARVALEPEDTVVVAYAPPGDAPQQASKTCTVSAIDWSRGPKLLTMKVSLRDYTAWV